MAGAFALASPLSAIDIVDDFTGTEVDPAIWENTGLKSRTVENSLLTFVDDGGDWGSGDISSLQRFLLPPDGETTTIEWTLGASSITTPNEGNDGRSIRYQVGIHSADETALGREHWLNTTGGLWIDLDNISLNDTANVGGFARYADDTKIASTEATNLGELSLPWNWQTETKVLRLEFTNTDYTWYDGTTLLYSSTFSTANIDTEFNNGFRVLGLGMNFSTGRGTTSIDRVAITNATLPSALLTTFQPTKSEVTSGESFMLSWLIANDSSASIDQDLGNIDALTTAGAGAATLIAPEVTEAGTIDYTLTVTRNDETEMRIATVTILPAPELSLMNLSDDFDGTALDAAVWETSGEQSFSVEGGLLTWDDGGSDWSQGEIDSIVAFPVPEAGQTTIINWTYGPGEVTNSSGDNTALRPLMGIFSSFERETFSKQHWQNTSGGIWLDLINTGTPRTDGVSGNIRAANDTKPFESNAALVADVDIPDWNWQAEVQTFTLELTDTGFLWKNGETELGGGTYEEYGIDTEFSKGFRIMAMDGNHSSGRGTQALDSITVQNGAAEDEVITITDFAYDPGAMTLELSFTTRVNGSYTIQELNSLNIWEPVRREIVAQSTSRDEMFTNITAPKGIYRVIAE